MPKVRREIRNVDRDTTISRRDVVVVAKEIRAKRSGEYSIKTNTHKTAPKLQRKK